jgi:2',3'-cyclic-nucleotide 2'-phosphodiesterase
MNEKLKILFLGDAVGRPGRFGVRDFLAQHKGDYDFVVANVENASHGYGLTKRNYEQLLEYGVHAMTSGNHIWDRKEIFEYIEDADKLIRPLNYPEGSPGVGSRVYKLDENLSVGVINVLGQVFMNPTLNPWGLLKAEIAKMRRETPVILVDIHAEATAEKISCGYICAKEQVSAVIGTHTHVQTADETILDGGTAYITDAGFCGSCRSVIGMSVEDSVERLLKMLPLRLEVGELDKVQVNGVEIVVDSLTGRAESIKRIVKVMNLQDEVS